MIKKVLVIITAVLFIAASVSYAATQASGKSNVTKSKSGNIAPSAGSSTSQTKAGNIAPNSSSGASQATGAVPSNTSHAATTVINKAKEADKKVKPAIDQLSGVFNQI